MPVNVVMPQMGESIAEGTIVRWIKQVGDAVDRDEPLFEISTDKVDAEIPSPASGILTGIIAREGETVPVNSVVATIGSKEDVAAAAPAAVPAPAAPSSELPAAAAGQPEPAPDAAVQAEGEVAAAEAPAGSAAAAPTTDDLRRQKSSPLVRRIAQDNNVDITQIHGTGISGRVTKRDILDYIESGAAAPAAASPERAPASAPTPGPSYRPGDNVSIVPMTVMRKKIAEHMVLSARTSPHVYAIYEVNFARISALREKRRAEFEAAGARLTFTAFIAKATVDALRQFPIVNASIDGDNIVYKKDINLGIAVALDNGLIVPVVRHADEKNLLGLSRAIDDLAVRARAKKLSPDDVHSGTFTITNPGTFGALYGLPLINQPQVAILGVGVIEKRAVVIDDGIAIRPMCHLTLGFDHRLIDGAEGGRFLAFIKERLERFDEAWI